MWTCMHEKGSNKTQIFHIASTSEGIWILAHRALPTESSPGSEGCCKSW